METVQNSGDMEDLDPLFIIRILIFILLVEVKYTPRMVMMM